MISFALGMPMLEGFGEVKPVPRHADLPREAASISRYLGRPFVLGETGRLHRTLRYAMLLTTLQTLVQLYRRTLISPPSPLHPPLTPAQLVYHGRFACCSGVWNCLARHQSYVPYRGLESVDVSNVVLVFRKQQLDELVRECCLSIKLDHP